MRMGNICTRDRARSGRFRLACVVVGKSLAGLALVIVAIAILFDHLFATVDQLPPGVPPDSKPNIRVLSIGGHKCWGQFGYRTPGTPDDSAEAAHLPYCYE